MQLIIFSFLLAVCIYTCTCAVWTWRHGDDVVQSRDSRNPENKDTICCLPEQFEASAFMTAAIVFPTPRNGYYKLRHASGRVAYDVIAKKAYTHFNYTSVNWPEYNSTSVLIDFTSGIAYHYTVDGCTGYFYSKNMSFSCIPDSAKKLSEGVISGHVPITTYKYDQPNILTFATVEVQGHVCRPLAVSYANYVDIPDSGILYNMEVTNLTLGVKDRSVFEIPAQCNYSSVAVPL